MRRCPGCTTLKLPNTNTRRPPAGQEARMPAATLCASLSFITPLSLAPVRDIGSMGSPAVRTQREEILRHGIEAGVHDLVVHRENEHVVEVAGEQRLEVSRVLAVHMPCLG